MIDKCEKVIDKRAIMIDKWVKLIDKRRNVTDIPVSALKSPECGAAISPGPGSDR